MSSSVRLLRGWQGREAGTVLFLGSGQMKTLVQHGIAEWNLSEAKQMKASGRGKRKRNVHRDQRAGSRADHA